MSFSMGGFIREQQKPENTVGSGLGEKIAQYLGSAPSDDRDPGFHISQLWQFCPVKWVLQQVYKRPIVHPYSLRYRFDIGHALHEMMQRYLGGMQLLKGYWQCENGHRTKEVGLKPPACAECGKTKLSYFEIKIEQEILPGYTVVGRTDGVIQWEGEDMGLEIKSVEPEVLSTLTMPFKYPVFQLNMYMHLLRQSHFPKMRRGIILYVATAKRAAVKCTACSMEMGGTEPILLPIKQYMIDYTDMFWREATEKIKTAASLYAAYQKGELKVQDLLPRRICNTVSDGRKLECPVAVECFSTATLTKLVEEKAKELVK